MTFGIDVRSVQARVMDNQLGGNSVGNANGDFGVQTCRSSERRRRRWPTLRLGVTPCNRFQKPCSRQHDFRPCNDRKNPGSDPFRKPQILNRPPECETRGSPVAESRIENEILIIVQRKSNVADTFVGAHVGVSEIDCGSGDDVRQHIVEPDVGYELLAWHESTRML